MDSKGGGRWVNRHENGYECLELASKAVSLDFEQSLRSVEDNVTCANTLNPKLRCLPISQVLAQPFCPAGLVMAADDDVHNAHAGGLINTSAILPTLQWDPV